VVDVRIIGGGLPVFPGTYSNDFSIGSVDVHVRYPEGAKKFQVTTSLGELFKAGYVSVCTAAFFEVPVVSSVARRFRLRTSWKPSSCVVCCPVVLVV
jgi:hypothetical protein